ncbi:breast cancer metastasis-suppressor 1-like protein [Cimex lectularius]|uniref:Breast cancer metastasis-suppressor 1-like protein n=1 Tax=Cimex lectularius TaxID=79782 RepID=A0A8I6RTA4_CIMLE|nr:breast cancer metastasis-suppressor 1-like protein [Cimex lectularius]
MTSIKDEREDSDGDEMDHDSGDSDKSSSTSDSSDASDSDDSSEMDEEECERRRNECMETLAELERQFISLREQLYRERIAQIKTKLEEVHEGTAKEYTEPLQELQDNMRIRIEVAGILKKLRLENIENGFKAEEQAARQNFENEKSLLFDTLKEEIEEKIRRLEDDRNNVDLQQDIYTSTDKNSRSGKNGGRVWKRGNKDADSTRRKPVTVNGPYIVYMLSEADILEDWAIIKKALSNTKRSAVERKY